MSQAARRSSDSTVRCLCRHMRGEHLGLMGCRACSCSSFSLDPRHRDALGVPEWVNSRA